MWTCSSMKRRKEQDEFLVCSFNVLHLVQWMVLEHTAVQETTLIEGVMKFKLDTQSLSSSIMNTHCYCLSNSYFRDWSVYINLIMQFERDEVTYAALEYKGKCLSKYCSCGFSKSHSIALVLKLFADI